MKVITGMGIVWIAVILLLIQMADAHAESSYTEGSGSLTASARIDIRIVIPPTVSRAPDGSLTDNFGERSGWQYDEDKHGVLTLSNP